MPSPGKAREERPALLLERDRLEAEAAALRRLAVTRPLAEITEEIQGEVKKRLEKEKEVLRTKEKLGTIAQRVRKLSSQQTAPLPASLKQAERTLGSVEIAAQQSVLIAKQMAGATD